MKKGHGENRVFFTYLSYKKGKSKNFPPNAPLCFGKAFEVPRNFSRPTFLERKGRQKNFPSNALLCFGEAFEIPKDFSRKVLCVRVWGRCPNL